MHPTTKSCFVHVQPPSSNPPFWGEKVLLEVKIFEDRVEHIYQAYPNFTYTFDTSYPGPRIWKEIITWKDGKTVVTEIDGRYVPATDESYEFD